MSQTVSRVWGTLIPWLLPPAICTGRVGSSGQKPCMQVLVVGSRPTCTKMLRIQRVRSGHRRGVLGTILGRVQEVAPLEREERASR